MLAIEYESSPNRIDEMHGNQERLADTDAATATAVNSLHIGYFAFAAEVSPPTWIIESGVSPYIIMGTISLPTNVYPIQSKFN
jgi:hypothetical protein